MTVVFDCAGSGIKNLDMDNMQFMINSFKEDYPWCLNYILVYEMPWIMNGMRVILLIIHIPPPSPLEWLSKNL